MSIIKVKMNEKTENNQLKQQKQPDIQNQLNPKKTQSPIRSTTVHPTLTSSIIPLKQLLNDNNDSNIAEMVSLEIINKLITLVARGKYGEEIQTRISQICCDFVIESINPCLQQESLAYDQCESVQENIIIFYNNCFIDTNTWEELIEPTRPFIEREASTLMTLKKATEEEELKYDTLPRRASLTRQSNIPTEASIQAEEDKVSSTNKHKQSFSKLKLSNKLVLHLKDKDSINENESSNTNKHHQPSKTELNSLSLGNHTKVSITKGRGRRGKANYDDDEEYDNSQVNDKSVEIEANDLPKKIFENQKISRQEELDLDELRRERILEIERREEEEKRRLEQEKKDYYASIAITKHVKEFESNRYTFDSNGQVMTLRQPRVDSFASEFWWSKQIIKDGPTFPNEMPKEKPASSPQKKAHVDESAVEKIEKPIVDKRNSSRALKPIKENNVYNENQIVRSINLEPFKINYSKFAHMKNNHPVTPAGNNMSIMFPEVGVIISDEHLRKEGKMEFSAKFNRPSMQEFSRIVLESNNNQSKQHLMTSLESQKGLDDSNSYIGYAEKFPSSNNPLAKNTLMSRNVSAIGRRNTNLMKIRTSDNPLITEPDKQLYNSAMNNETISLNNKLQTSLKAAIDMVDENIIFINHNHLSTDNNLPNVSSTNDLRNLFKDRKIKKMISFRDSIKKEEERVQNRNIIDSFNSNIVKSNNWGNSNVSSNRDVYFRKPAKSNYIKELGYQIVATKLPRSRRLEASIKLTK